MKPLKLHPDRFFDANPAIRDIARELFEGIKHLPIVSPHGHTEPAWFSENAAFPDPTGLILIPDHYIFRMLYSQGIPLENLGIPTRDGTAVETDHRKIWQIFANHFYLYAGTPTGIWLAHEFSDVFGVTEKLDSESAQRIYDQIAGKLQSPEFRPRALFDRFNIEVLSTTDAAESDLAHHKKIQESGWNGRIVPTFRPDGVTDLRRPDWHANLNALSDVSGIAIHSYRDFIRALEKQRSFFKSMGAVATDHGVETPFTQALTANDAERIFGRALAGDASADDATAFTAHMLMEMARMSCDDGLVMQIHAGSMRNHNAAIFNRYGLDKGADIPMQTEYTRNLHALLNTYGNNSAFRVIVFTLDETTYSRELAPLAGHYPAMRLGPPWWFHDSIEGMIRFRQMVTETAGIYNTVGFNDDTRAFPSIPARHDVARRMDCNFLAGLVARHIIDMDDAVAMSRALTYDLVKSSYNL
ncbi:MAG: glucuronate isomerase [Calditrichae bacterium]|nr:glucuronate isomerase [Calditrichia bacterium]